MNDFIEKIAPLVQKYAPRYGILCNSAVIAQAILESGWGESRLSKEYHNYFGLKCGTLWQGKSVNMKTQEEYEPGTLTTISDNFGAYDSMEDGIKGYFEFIQLPRYQNLRGITYYRTYLQTIKADGYATDSSYVTSTCKLVEDYGLEEYDKTEMGRTAQDYINVFRSWIGFSEANGKHRQIIDLYNSHKPLARNYAVQYNDAWCDTTVSAAAIKAGMVDLIGTECGCEEHVKIFKNKGIWIEDGTITPKPGYIVLYNWDTGSQPNDGYSDHIGVVESVSNGQITVIEGNKDDAVGRRTIPVGWGYIRGYAAPKYDEAEQVKPAEPDIPLVKEKNIVQIKETKVVVPYVKKGNTGAMVKMVQVALNYIGGYGIDEDGEFGTATDKALKDFQKKHKINTSGTCGITSFRAIMEEVAKWTFLD